MNHAHPVLSRDTTCVTSFLDHLGHMRHQWSLAPFDPDSGGFRCNEHVGILGAQLSHFPTQFGCDKLDMYACKTIHRGR